MAIATFVVAVYAALVSTMVAMVTFYEKLGGARLKFKASVEWAPGSHFSTPNEAAVYITVTNLGHRRVSLTHIIPIAADAKEGRVVEPAGLPCAMARGESATIVADAALAGDGWTRIEVEDSVGRRYRIDSETHAKMKAQARPLLEWQAKIRAASAGHSLV